MAPEQKRNVHPASANEACQDVENAGCETVKRPSCKWKGQTDADEELPEARVARLAECHNKQKAGYNQHASLYNCNPSLLNVLIKMKNQARSDDAIKNTSKALTTLSKHADLNNPEQVKQYIANLQVSTSYKRNLCIAYNKYCIYYQIKWKMPHYKQQSKMIKIPTKEKLEMLIANANNPLFSLYSLSQLLQVINVALASRSCSLPKTENNNSLD